MRIIIVAGLIALALAHPMKRQAQNSYGDEAAPAPAAAAPEQSFAAEPSAPAETAPEPVAQEETAPEAPAQDAGYRSKRQAQNSYGDEAAAPAVEESAPAAEQPVEQAAEPVAQEEAAPEAPAQDAGYRSKRQAQNSYGDEAAAAPAVEESAPAAEQPVEQAAEPVAQEEAAPEAPAQDAGYRSKRQAQNSYGDEAAAAPAVEESAPAAEQPVEQAAEPVAQEEAAPEAPAQDAGYRSKRQAQNSYGDEAAAAPAVEESAPAAEQPVEQAAEPVAQEEAVPEAPAQDAGYRSKRQAQNSYGDEAAAAPAAEESAPAAEQPVEQAAEPVAQEETAPEAPAQDAGYRA
ncbi:Ascaris suum EPICuticlin protein related [Caenorhabditis elegans]|uniref:Ascaris suum EPICuticlin protein related n=1 Tax=Caenorhabditis elegans TaxID=6239 RepID=Q9U3J8_CAEEL|nr:Ascaris suum EPICuticlin protein related [Caenorhabditis elegans]CAB62800.1 Ascaris suum EPICuticlin protein related [Caenorhabditis elegans]|eukprot:NP_503116.1 Uncharacterized protein CELE_F11E6.3 [Caenorhabditis elegans]